MTMPSAMHHGDSSERRASRGSAPIWVGLLGCGTVGGGVLRLLSEHAPRLVERVGAPLQVKRVLVRDMSKPRVPECRPGWLTTSAADIVDDPAIDLVVEVMGGEDTARGLIERALKKGKGVVTANKLLLASRGPELLELAVERRADLAFEGAVGGGIPIVRTLREAFASDSVKSLTAILNGTCNYVLTRMTEAGVSLSAAVSEAQERGYAEADPSLDIDGHDAAHKLIVLAMLAFGARVDPQKVFVEGIRHVEEADIRFAARFGYVVKHLARGSDLGDSVELRVHPTLIAKSSVLANVSGVLNAVLLEGRALGPSLVYGRGAGDMPTAVSVVADILDVARSIGAGVSGLQTRGISIARRPLRLMTDIISRYYLRFTVADRPRVMARLAGALGQAGVSIEQIVQESPAASAGGSVEVVMITHRAIEWQVRQALESLAGEPFLSSPPRLFRIEDV
jgi:homoserine dehydrogenase